MTALNLKSRKYRQPLIQANDPFYEPDRVRATRTLEKAPAPEVTAEYIDDYLENLASQLRFEHGDLAIHLSYDGTHDILVPSANFAANCPGHAGSLNNDRRRAQFSRSERTQVPGEQTPRDIFHLGLVEVEGTYVLESNEFGLGPRSNRLSRLFGRSSILENHELPWVIGDTTRTSWHLTVQEAARNYMVLAKIFLGMELELEDLSYECWYPQAKRESGFGVAPHQPSSADAADFYYDEDDRQPYTPWPMHRVLEGALEVCARAAYLGCLPLVSRVILDKIVPHPDFWRAVAHRPASYLHFAYVAKDDQLYWDAYRHLLARAILPPPRYFQQYFGITQEFLLRTAEPLLAEQSDTLTKELGRELRQLGNPDKAFQSWATGLSNTEWRRVTYACGNIWHQWLAKYESKVPAHPREHVFRDQYDPEWPDPFYNAIILLERAETKDQQRELFASEIDEVLELFPLDIGGFLRPYIEGKLEIIVDKARMLIERATEPYTERGPNGRRFERCGVELHATGYVVPENEVSSHLTFLGLDESDTPWKDDLEIDGEGQLVGRTFNRQRASDVLLRAVGIL